MRSRLSSSSIVIVALLLAIACAPSNPGIVIEGVVSSDDDCAFTPGELYRLGARLDTRPQDVLIRPNGITFVVGLQVANQMMNRGDFVYPLMADPNTWYAREAEIELRGLDGAQLTGLPTDLSPRFRVPVNGGAISSAGSVDEPGRGIVILEVIPAAYGDALATRVGTIIAAIRLNGITTGDSVQNTGEFLLPIDLCDGCLTQCILNPENCVPTAFVECPYPAGQDTSTISVCSDAQVAACRADLVMP